MSEYVCLLITVCNGEQLLKCALKIKPSNLAPDLYEYPMEYISYLQEKLPLHVSNFGNIVHIEEIFEIELAK